MGHRYLFGPRDGSITSLIGLVRLNDYLTRPDTELGRLPPGEERTARFTEGFRELAEWEAILMASPGFREVILWINVELGKQAYDPEGVEEMRRELAIRLESPFHEIDRLTLAHAADELRGMRKRLLSKAEIFSPSPAVKPLTASEAEAPDNRRTSADLSADSNPTTLDDRASALLTRWTREHVPKISKRKLARALGCHHSSLDDCPIFQRVWELNKNEPKPGYPDPRTGDMDGFDYD